MATTDKKQATRTTIDELNEKLSSAEQSVEKNKKKILYAVIAAVAVVAIGFWAYYGFYQNKVSETKELVGKADAAKMEGQDSMALKLYKQAAEGYGKFANRANLEAAIILFNQGKAADALTYLEAYSSEESLIGYMAQTLKGDCNVNLKKYDDAVACYEKAVKVADGNKMLVPFAMYKKAIVLAAQNKHAEAAKVFEEISNQYPAFAPHGQGGLDIQKLMEQEKFRAAGDK